MKKKLLLLALALACLACLFAVTISATDEGTPTLSVNYTNLTFKDSVYIKYAVAAENVAPEDVRLLVFTEPQDDYTDISKATVLMPKYLDTVNGAEHIIFDYTNLSAKQMTDVVYACAMVEVDGEAYYSNVKKYSILEYAHAVANNASAKASLKNMLAGMLGYGALAQTHFAYKADRPANGAWVTVDVVNGTLPDGFTSGMYLAGDTLTLIPAAAPKGQVFSHWVNAAGEEQPLPLTVPAKDETYTAVYRDEVYSQGLKFTLNEDGQSYSVTSIGTCTDTEIIIPAIYEGLPVTSIGNYAFYNCSSLTSIAIPDSVTSIGSSAFSGCSGLTSVTFGENSQLTSIGSSAFSGCKNITSFVIPDCATSIGDGAFSGWSSLTSITIPDSVTSIGEYAFYNCSSLTSITIPDSVTSIGNSAFRNCSSLTSVTFGENSQLTSIGNYAFYGCSSLTSIEIPDSATSIGEYAFYNCSSLTSIVISDSVTSIGNYVFYNCSNLTSVTFGENSHLTSIGGCVFYGCTNLTNITIPNSVTSIGSSAFRDCSGLTSVTFGENSQLTSIGNYAFYGCSSLTSIEIPDSATSIGEYAFYNCSSLTSIVISDSVTSVGNYAFYNCSSLTSILIPDSVTSIDVSAFENCTSLASVTFGENSQLTSIGNYAFYNCSSLTSIAIPDSVTSIGSSAFRGCSGLTSVTFWGKSRLKSIGSSAFYDCTNLTSITIPNSVKSIGYLAFRGCAGVVQHDNGISYVDKWMVDSNNKSMTTVSLRADTVGISDRAFYFCNRLTSIVIPNSVKSIGSAVFENCKNLTEIRVAEGNTAYHSSGNCLIETGTKTLIAGCQSSIIPADGSVTSIQRLAFYGCSELTNITIPDSVTSIGNQAFEGCTNVIKKENDVSYVDRWVIDCDTSAVSVALRVDTAGIADQAFFGCSNLKSIEIPAGVTSISEYAFRNCSSLTSIVIPDSVTSIGECAFRSCVNLTSIKYSGTETQWQAINKGNDWDIYTGPYTITYNYKE